MGRRWSVRWSTFRTCARGQGDSGADPHRHAAVTVPVVVDRQSLHAEGAPSEEGEAPAPTRSLSEVGDAYHGAARRVDSAPEGWKGVGAE